MTAKLDDIQQTLPTPKTTTRIILSLSEPSAKLLYLTLRCLSDEQKFPPNSVLKGGAAAMAYDLEDFLFSSEDSDKNFDLHLNDEFVFDVFRNEV